MKNHLTESFAVFLMNFLSSAEMENRRDSCTLEPYAPDGERKGSCGRGDVRSDFNMSRGGLWENWRGQKTARLCVWDSSSDRRARFMHCEVGRMLGCLDSPCGVGEAGDGMECFVRLRLRSCIDKLRWLLASRQARNHRGGRTLLTALAEKC